MPKRQFGVSTRLYLGNRLSREDLLQIAASGFESVELVASRPHLDYHNPAVVADLQQWLGEAGLTLGTVHVPVGEDPEQALFVARRIPVPTLVIETGTPREAARTIEHLAPLAPALGVAIAIDSSTWSPIGSLVHFVEEGVDAAPGICLDFGHSRIDGDLSETIEIVAEHLSVAHVHDSRGRRDERLVPFDGAIDWLGAMIELQKVGYEGTLMFDVGGGAPPKQALGRLRTARERIERLLD